MKQLEDFLIKRMSRSAVWFFGSMIAIVVGLTALGTLAGKAAGVTGDWPFYLGFGTGAAIFLTLFCWVTVYDRSKARESQPTPEEILLIIRQADQELLDAVKATLMGQVELLVQAMLQMYPDMPEAIAFELAQLVTDARRKFDQIIDDARRRDPVG